MGYAQRILDLQMTLSKESTPFVTVTLFNIKGSAPQEVGAKMLVTQDGLLAGTIGGGKIEAHCLKKSVALLSDSENNPSPVQHEDLNLQTNIGMTCGGWVSVLYEINTAPRWTIAVFGAGHLSQHLIPLLLTLDLSVHCIDPRQEWLDKLPHSSRLKTHCIGSPVEILKDLPKTSFIVSMTKGHAFDVPILYQALKTHSEHPKYYPFIGVIGSKSKAGAIKLDLKKQGLSQADLEAMICPLGLPLGNNTPPEIAMSICSQLLQERDRRLSHYAKWPIKNPPKGKTE